MEFIAALIGAIIGAVASFTLSEYSKRRDERKRVLTALRAEIKLNLDVIEEIRKVNTKKSVEWYEIIPFSEMAWAAVMSAGALSYLRPHMVEPLLRAYAKVKRANYTAVKMQYGRFDRREGEEYTKRVLDSEESLNEALDILA